MNLRAVSGWLMGPASIAYTPEGVKRLLFTVVLRDDLGHEFPERVMIEDGGLIARIGERLQAGCAVVIGGRCRAWPMHGKGGAHIGWDRWIFATDVEVTRPVSVMVESEVRHG